MENVKNMHSNSDSVLPKFIVNALENIARKEKLTDYNITSSPRNSGSYYLSTIDFITISGNVAKEDKIETISIVVKSLPQTENLKNECIPDQYKFFKRESFVYKDFLPEIMNIQREHGLELCQFAKCFLASSESKEKIVILENLFNKDYKMFTGSKSFDYNHIELVIKYIADYHAVTFALKQKNPHMTKAAHCFTMLKENFSDKFPQIMRKCTTKALDVIEDIEHRRRVDEYCKDIMEKFYQSLDLEGQDELLYNTFCHGDLWMNNILFKYKDGFPTDMVLLDWQFFRYASPLTDIFHLLYTSVDEEFRTKHMTNVLDLYYNTLQESLSRMDCDPEICYPEKIFRKQILDKLPYGLLVGVSIIPLVLVDKSDFTYDGCVETEVADILCNAQYNEMTIKWINGVVKDMIKFSVI